MKLQEIYQLFKKYPNIATNSKQIPEKAIFVALKGAKFDANTFAADALQNGAKYAIIDNADYAEDERYILVDNTLKTLQDLANLHRRTLNIPILAITGTNGKTTTKELVNSVLQTKFNTSATKGNFNNHIGVPLTLLAMNENTEFGIVEMGANNIGEIAFLCEIAEPNYGLITNVGKAHLEGFGSFEGVMQTKKELYDYLHKTNGKVFINTDNPYLKQMLNQQEFYSYGTTKEADSTATLLQANPFLVAELQTPMLGKIYAKTKLLGDFNFENVLAAIAVAQYFGIDNKNIVDAIENYTPTNKRSQMEKVANNNVLFLYTYNANPNSMSKVLPWFASLSHKNKLLILGDMLELGDYTLTEHQKVIDTLTEKEFRNVWLVGKHYKAAKTPEYFRHFDNSEQVIEQLKENPFSHCWILIMGSNSIKLGTVAEALSTT